MGSGCLVKPILDGFVTFGGIGGIDYELVCRRNPEGSEWQLELVQYINSMR